MYSKYNTNKNGLSNFKFFKSKYYNKGSTSWAELSAKCKQRAGYKCKKCKKDFFNKRHMLEAHHIIPLSKGGKNILPNLMCLCRECHNKLHPHMKNRKV